MTPETSRFESSEMVATFLASTRLPEESWRLCGIANASHHRSFAVDVVGSVAYVAFSGVQVVGSNWSEERDLVEVGGGCGEVIFGSLARGVGDGEEAAMVHGGLLQLFLSFYHSQNFQQKIVEILNKSKSVVFTGHSVGGAVASLSALWLLSHIQTTNSLRVSVFCITFGTPLLIGNHSFSQAILQERWGGNFCHILSQHDIPPAQQLLFRHLSSGMDNVGLLENNVLACVPYWPFGSYVFCMENGAICLDNPTAILKFLYLMLAKESANYSRMEEDCVGRLVSCQHLMKRSCVDECLSFSESSNEAGIALALQSSGISSKEPYYGTAMKWLATARQLGWQRNLHNAKMAIYLARITPCRAELEWYKEHCDTSNQRLGYYDSFKHRGASKREFKVNMNRIKLGRFWDDLIEKLEKNQLTRDFHNISKYVNASQSYKLLVEPLEIAEYYGSNKHKEKGHYIERGRERRFKIFDKWWRDRKIGDEESKPRSKYASLTQDSCFWARVEEARDHICCFVGEREYARHLALLEKIEEFGKYARWMIERKEVSVDVMAENSSYSKFVEEWRELKSQLQASSGYYHQ